MHYKLIKDRGTHYLHREYKRYCNPLSDFAFKSLQSIHRYCLGKSEIFSGIFRGAHRTLQEPLGSVFHAKTWKQSTFGEHIFYDKFQPFNCYTLVIVSIKH